VIDLEQIRRVIQDTLTVFVRGIKVPGIAEAALRKAALSLRKLQSIAAQLERHSYGEINVSAEVELFLRMSSMEALLSIESAEFLIKLNRESDDVIATVSTEKDWETAWERGIEAIKDPALQSLRTDVRNMTEIIDESDYGFQAAMVLFASELVGPYEGCLASFLGYPRCLVQVMAARLQEAKIWEGEYVNCGEWFDPQTGTIAFMLDLRVAEGKMIRTWSQERKRYLYRESNVRTVSRFAV
jgi:hypothetical protein